jgi:DNA-binding NarL/FixJ family response regulator
MVYVLIADDHKVVRDGLRAALKNIPDLEIIDEVADGTSLGVAIEAQHHHLSVVLLNLTMPQFPDPVGFVRETKTRYPHLRFVVMTGQSDDAMINRMIEIGVDGYLLKTSTDDLAMVISRVLAGQRYFSHEAAHVALTSRHRYSVAPVRLSQREYDVLSLVVQGLTNEQIGEQLKLAEGTIRNYITRLMEKCDVSNRTALATHALRHGLV